MNKIDRDSLESSFKTPTKAPSGDSSIGKGRKRSKSFCCSGSVKRNLLKNLPDCRYIKKEKCDSDSSSIPVAGKNFFDHLKKIGYHTLKGVALIALWEGLKYLYRKVR
ncbi:MAG: hypothetical protein AAGE99_05885, partial [Chlamydiota bacterium]